MDLIPPLSCALARYSRVFAPNFKSRDEIILCPGQRKRKVSVGAVPCSGKSNKVKASGGSWGRILLRVFSVDVSKCSRCRADLKIMSAELDGDQISRYLKYVGKANSGLTHEVVIHHFYRGLHIRFFYSGKLQE